MEAYILWVHLLHNTPKRPNVSSFCCVPELNFLTSAQVQVQIVNNIFIVRKGDLYLMENISQLFCSFCHFDLFSLVHIVHFLHLTRFLIQITRTKYTYILRLSWVCFDTKSCIFKILVLKNYQ